ncbi:MAG TPA: hypothetical protein DCF63_04170 [Planctomycetaceae bacterium]|nr:hypothetical protein [Planctomycetaceae bacterium]
MRYSFFSNLIGGLLIAFSTASNVQGQTGVLQIEGFTVECTKKIEVAAQADGLISMMAVEEGSTVPAGELLFQIDDRVSKAQLDVAVQELESAIKQANQDADVRFAKATHEVALAESEAERALLGKGATTLAAVRRKDLERDKAKLQIEVAEVKRQTDALAGNVARAKKNAAEVQLGLYSIKAPWDAIVNERIKIEGAWSRAGEPVLKILHMYEMRAVGYVSLRVLEERGLSLADLEGAPIRIAVKVSSTYSHVVDTQIGFVSGEIADSKDFRVWANLKNERIGNSWVLRDGMPASVTISVK